MFYTKISKSLNKLNNNHIIDMKFRLIKDLVLSNGLEEEVILKKGDVVSPNDKGEYFFDKLNKSYCIDDLLSKMDTFDPIEEIDLVIKEIDRML